MIISRRSLTFGSLGLLSGAAFSAPALAELGGLNLGEGLEDFWLATDAYIFGYPLVTMDMTRRIMTNVAAPEGNRGPDGAIYQGTAISRRIVPRRDSSQCRYALHDRVDRCWQGAVGPQHPRHEGPVFSDSRCSTAGPTCFRSLASGRREQARKPMLSPARSGRVPCRLASRNTNRPPTSSGSLGRIYCTGTPEDYEAVHSLQDQCKLVPLSSYGKPYTPPEGKVDPSIDMKTAVREQVNRMDAREYFTLLAQLMKTNPPAAADAPELARFAKIGLVPGQDFDASKLNADFVKRIPQVGFDRIMLQFKLNKELKDINGWMFTTKTGLYGTDYLMRAFVTAIGLGANRPQDAVYPTSLKDADGRAYDGANKYVMHFPKGQLPPVRGLLVGYDVRRRLFLRQQPDQSLLDQRSAKPQNQPGRLDRSPHPEGFARSGPEEFNWLPAPAGKFILMLRMYWPNEESPSIINGSWTIPPVKKV